MADTVIPPSLQEDYAIAVQAADPVALTDVKTRGMGTAIAPKAQAQMDRLTVGVAPIQEALDAGQAKGGVQTPQGRMAAIDQAVKSYKAVQPEVSFWKGFSQGLMGNPKWRDAATEGVIRPTILFGNDGDFVIAQMAQNSDVPKYVERPDGTPVNLNELAAGGYAYKTPAETPGYAGKQETFRKYAEQNAKDAQTANVAAAVFTRKAANADFIIGSMQKLKDYGLSNDELNQLTEETTREFANTATVRTGLEQLKNAQDSESIRSALDLINSAGGGIDGKFFKFDGNNKFSDQAGKSYSLQGLLQMGSSYNSAAERQKRFTQSREQIVESAVLKKLPTEQAKALWQQTMDRIWQNEQLTSDFNQKYGGLPFISNPAPYKPGQSMKVAIANALQDQANAELAIKYQNFYQEVSRKGMLVPGQAAANFVKNPQLGYEQTIKSLNDDIAAINAMSAPQTSATPVVTRDMAAPQGGLQNIMSQSQQGRLGETVGEAALSKTPIGVPARAKKTNRVTPDGKAIYELDGKMFIQD